MAEFIVGLAKTAAGGLYVQEILDVDFGMPMTSKSEIRTGKTVDDIPQTLWKHPFTRGLYRFRAGELYELFTAERKITWTYSNSSRRLLKNS